MMICPACLSQCQLQEGPVGAQGAVAKCEACAATWSVYEDMSQSAGGRALGTAHHVTENVQEETLVDPRSQGASMKKAPTHTNVIMTPNQLTVAEDNKASGFWDTLQHETSLLLYDQPSGQQEKMRGPSQRLQVAAKMAPLTRPQVLPADGQSQSKTNPAHASTSPPTRHEDAQDVLMAQASRVETQKNGLRDRLVQAYRVLFLKAPTVGAECVLLQTDPAVEGIRRHARWRARNALTPMRLLGWYLWVSSVFTVVYIPTLGRENVVRFWPESRELFAAIGLVQQRPTLVLTDILHRYAVSDQGPVVEIRGTVSNHTSQDALAPFIQVIAYGEDNSRLADWRIKLRVAQLRSGMELPFISRAAAPRGIRRIVLYPEYNNNL